ncbi:MAG: pyridoxal phosphate-dependent aminotransferase [Evtepia sp.]|uniref:pyridoxal phosphate-dependent aminotransferase n=1 Tax=Evtepia sp. TaxID=2773933 RepID=UPI002A75EDA0|nr:pyridoxal phosphate-dependent aminotransferase [Evtepia sp.]MDY3014936.1 pyridoxal phosphate-dependent aminotransferase [Evtepia sp.]
MKELSALAQSVRASTTIAIDTQFKKMRAEGIDVIGFGMGEPDFPTPEHIKQAGIRAIENDQTKYTPTPGTMEVRKAVCKRMLEDWGVSYEPEEVIVNAGAKHILYVTLKTLVNPGDEVILPAPYWVSYYEIIKMVGGVPVVVDTTEASGFKMSAQQLKDAITPKTKALIFNNPSNPTGMMYSREQMEELAKVCVEEDLYVISDEIYGKLTFDGKQYVSFPSLSPEIKERTILVNGVSKSYAMTGWRIGFAAGNRDIIKVMSNYLSHCISGTSAISQAAAAEAFAGEQDEIETMRKEFEVRRDYLYERMNKIPGVHAVRSEATFYMLMNLEELVGKTLYGVEIHDSDDFAKVFLEKGLVAVVPCTGFGAPNYVRWSFAVSMENIKEGLDRLENFLKNA